MAYSRRVVVTGCGVISPLGNSVQELVDGLQQGRSGVATLQRIPADGLPVSYGGEALLMLECKPIDVEDVAEKREELRSGQLRYRGRY